MLRNKLKEGVVFLCLLSFFFSQAQKKDTLKIKDTRFFYEGDLYNNTFDIFNPKAKLREVDTSFSKVHQYEMWYRQGEVSQDLGAIGSAVKPFYYKAPEVVGQTLGYTAFDPYTFQNKNVKYYDTKRPYTELDIALLGNARNIVNVDFARNIDARSSFGVVFKRLTAKDPIGTNPSNDPFSNHYSSQVFFNYHTKNNRYHLLANYRWMNHRLFDTGGVKMDSNFVYPNDYFLDIAEPNLLGVVSNDRRNNWHFYQQYNLFDSSVKAQVFHVFDREKQKYQYLDENPSQNKAIYPNAFLDPALTNDSSTFEVFTNKLGLKGKVENLRYSVFALNRSFIYTRSDFMRYVNYENYVGGDFSYTLQSLFLGVNYSQMLGGELGNVRFNAMYKGLDLTYSRSKHQATMVNQVYLGNHIMWLKDFESITSSSLEVSYKLQYKTFTLTPFVGKDEVVNYIYFAENANPYQADETIKTAYVGSRYAVGVFNNHLGLRGFVKHYQINSDLMRAPKLFWHNQLFLSGKLFNGVMNYETGIDTYFRDAFYAYGYQPIIQQFVLQDKEKLWDTWIVDLFFNFKVKNLIMFFKVNHLNQGLNGYDGYLSSAGYSGQRRAIGFGVKWRMFN